MGHGKTLELFLVNGTADDVVTAELSNWNAQAIRIPRLKVSKPDHEHITKALQGVGVYFLVCQNDGGKEEVYVGEAENVHKRLCDHLKKYERDEEKYYWNYAIVFVGGRLDKALIRYLENRIVTILKGCGRCECLTKNTYQNVALKPSQIDAMEEFIDNVRVVLSALGCRFLEPQPSTTLQTQIFRCKGRNSDAKGFESQNGFTVLEGSRVASSTVASFEGDCYYDLRERLEADGTIVECKFVRNHEFSSPSAAAAVVIGSNANGKTNWKTSDGRTLGEVQKESQGATAPDQAPGETK